MDAVSRGNQDQLYEDVLETVRQFCSDQGTSLIQAGVPLDVVVETGEELMLSQAARDNLRDAVARIAQNNLPATAVVNAIVVPADGLDANSYRIVLPSIPTPDGPAARPARPATASATTTARLAFEGTSPAGPDWTEPTWQTSGAAPAEPRHRGISLPPIPEVGSSRGGGLRTTQRVIRFTYGATIGAGSPNWLFTVRSAPRWIPLGRGLEGTESQPGMDLSTLRSIPGGRLLFVCFLHDDVFLLRSDARPDYLISLDSTLLGTRQVVSLPADGKLRWTHRTRPGESVLWFDISGRTNA